MGGSPGEVSEVALHHFVTCHNGSRNILSIISSEVATVGSSYASPLADALCLNRFSLSLTSLSLSLSLSLAQLSTANKVQCIADFRNLPSYPS